MPAIPLLASAPPPLPSSFYGTVQVDGTTAAAGVPVSAQIDGVVVVQSATFLYKGRVYYALNVPGDDLSTPQREGGRPGETIVFSVNETSVPQTGAWQGGANLELNLSSTAAE